MIRLLYGPDALHFGDLRLPAGAGPHPVVALIHGGFWRARYGLDLMDGLGEDLARRGIASWNIEYRRVGDPGGGWPGTLEDVARATDHLRTLAETYPLDLTRLVALGHSAGGHLALWLAGRARLPAGLPGASGPGYCPVAGAIGLAAVTDLVEGWRRGLSVDAVAAFIGGTPATAPERYAVASPRALLPLGVPQALVHGAADDIVPPALSRDYAAAATAAGDAVRLHELPGVEHFAVIDPTSAAWAAIVEELQALLAGIGTARGGKQYRRHIAAGGPGG